MSFLWLEYKESNPNGYQITRFYKLYNDCLKKHYGINKVSMPVERVQGEKMYIDWVDDTLELLLDPNTGELKKVHVFTTTLGFSSIVYEGRNPLITGMASSDKTYLCDTLYVSAIRQIKTVKYIKTSHLMMELEQVRIKDNYIGVLTSLNTKTALLTIDDFGLMELDTDKCQNLFEVIDGRDERRSTIIISQYPVKTWFDMFKDGTYVDACLSRIIDQTHTSRNEMNGRSMQKPV